MSEWRTTLICGLLIGCLAGLMGCDANPEVGGSSAAQDSAATPSDGEGAIRIRDQDVACETPTHYGQIRWQNGQPSLTFVRKPADLTLTDAMPVGIIGNPDGSVTYGFQGEAQFYMRIYPDLTCFLQIVDGTDRVTLEENGQVILGTVSPAPSVGVTGPGTALASRSDLDGSVHDRDG